MKMYICTERFRLDFYLSLKLIVDYYKYILLFICLFLNIGKHIETLTKNNFYEHK